MNIHLLYALLVLLACGVAFFVYSYFELKARYEHKIDMLRSAKSDVTRWRDDYYNMSSRHDRVMAGYGVGCADIIEEALKNKTPIKVINHANSNNNQIYLILENGSFSNRCNLSSSPEINYINLDLHDPEALYDLQSFVFARFGEYMLVESAENNFHEVLGVELKTVNKSDAV